MGFHKGCLVASQFQDPNLAQNNQTWQQVLRLLQARLTGGGEQVRHAVVQVQAGSVVQAAARCKHLHRGNQQCRCIADGGGCRPQAHCITPLKQALEQQNQQELQEQHRLLAPMGTTSSVVPGIAP